MSQKAFSTLLANFVPICPRSLWLRRAYLGWWRSSRYCYCRQSRDEVPWHHGSKLFGGRMYTYHIGSFSYSSFSFCKGCISLPVWEASIFSRLSHLACRTSGGASHLQSNADTCNERNSLARIMWPCNCGKDKQKNSTQMHHKIG